MDGLECELWHGTKESNVDLICKNNLDYRLVIEQKFGKGVSFSKYFSYAFHYSVSNRPMLNKEYCVFLCKVIKNKCHIGSQGLKYPKSGYDSTMKSNEDVIVKYDDDTFYPMYKIGFTINSKNVFDNDRDFWLDDENDPEFYFGDDNDPEFYFGDSGSLEFW
ncbi:PREDICTED: poly [ADP-ribose] polymerase 12-like [Nicrophorus vespilloides]|uniref:Poly [ADP-ribose] polymerase n=1 Tax=Nicrophorus vespilloides TaxID=110193 RepID=A0ABM1N0X9_NICVS|nr:PREDICTED: poly [ADP-ribose] polymerase 12-like [Nicrophorus vespilloides]